MNALLSQNSVRFAAAIAVVLAVSAGTRAQTVVVFDGFGDADRNNNGIPLESDDTNFTEAGAVVGDGDSTTFTPERVAGADGTGPVNNEVTSVLDPTDTGIRWFGIRGFTDSPGGQTFPGFGDPSPTLRIIDDTQGALLETQPVTNPGGLGRTAIDDGFALSLEQRGRGAIAAGFFDSSVELGEDIGDEVTVSFDFRIFADTPREENFAPNFGNLRFGLYQDTDNQLGQTNPAAGRSIDVNGDGTETAAEQLTPQPAVWGFDDGEFGGNLNSFFGAGSEIGAAGDLGFSTELGIGENIPGLFDDGNTARIRIEDVAVGDEILQGQDNEPVASGAFGFGETPVFTDITDTSAVYNIGLTLRRVEVDVEVPVEGGAPEETETVTTNSIETVLFFTNLETGVTEELVGDGTDSDLFEEGSATLIAPESFDYFVIRGFGQETTDEFDFLIDNFTVAVIGLDALPGDFNADGSVDAADYVTFRGGGGSGTFSDFVNNFGAGGSPATAAAVPEPSGVLLLLAGVGLSVRRRKR